MSTKTLLKLYIEGETATEADVLAGAEGKLVTADVIAPLLGQAVPNEVVEAAVEQYFIDNPASGDVVGPASSISDRIAVFSGTSGKLLKVGSALGNGAFKDVGTTENTIAAGDDDRITGAVQADEIGDTPLIQFTGGRPGVLSQRFKDWGVTPDDFTTTVLRDTTANSSAWLLSAVAAVQAGDATCVRTLPGEYLFENSGASTAVLMDGVSGVHIIGAGRGRTILKLKGSQNAHLLSLVDCEDMVLRGFTVDGNRDNQTVTVHGIRGNGLYGVTLQDLEVREAAHYGIGLQDGVHERVRLIDLDIHDTGGDGIDIKNKDNGVTDNFAHNIAVRRYALNPDLTAQVGIDLRGHWNCSNIFISEPGKNDAYGWRSRFGDTDIENGAGGHECSLVNFRIDMGATTAGVGLSIGGRDNHIANGTVLGGQDGVVITNPRAQLVNVTFKGQSDDGASILVGGTDFDGGHDATFVNCRFSVGDTGINTECDNTQANGCTFDGCDEPFVLQSTASGFRLRNAKAKNTITRGGQIVSGATDTLIEGGDFDKQLLNAGTGLVVRNAKGLKSKDPEHWVCLAKSVGSVAHTGTTADTVVASASIPGGSMGAKGRLRVRALWGLPNNANSKTARIKMGASVFHSVAVTATASLSEDVVLANINSETAQAVYPGTGGIGASTAAVATYAFNTAADLTLNFTAILADAADTLTLHSWSVEVLYGE